MFARRTGSFCGVALLQCLGAMLTAAAVCILPTVVALLGVMTPVSYVGANESEYTTLKPYAARFKSIKTATIEAAKHKTERAVERLGRVKRIPTDSRQVLQGEWLLQGGKVSKARGVLELVSTGRGRLAPYAAYLVALSWGDDCAKTIEPLRKAVEGAGTRARALGKLCPCLVKLNRADEALDAYSSWLPLIPKPSERLPLVVSYGKLLLEAGDKAKGLTLLTESWLSDGSVGDVDEVLKRFYGDEWPTVLLFKRLKEGGRGCLSALPDKGGECSYKQALYKGAAARAARKKKEEALAGFEQGVAAAKSPMERALAAYLQARALESLDRDLEARDIYAKIVEELPSFPAARSLLVRMAQISIREGVGAEAVPVLQRYLDGATPGEDVAEGLWQLAFLERLQGRPTEARRLLQRLEREFFFYTRSSWEYYGPMARYWQGVCLREEERAVDSAAYMDVLAREFPSNYYGLLALVKGTRLAALPWPAAYETSPLQVPSEVRLPEAYETAIELFRLGLWDEAYREFSAQLGLGNMAPGVVAIMASAWFRTHPVNNAVSFRRAHGLLPAPWETGARLWRSSLRIRHVGSILESARESGLEPALIAAIIRFESDYNATLESHAGAVGLIQVKTNAGSDAAQYCLGQGAVSKKELRDPDRNLLLGSLYIAELLHRHHQNWPVSLAAFNAGPGTARWWLGRFGGLGPDEFIEQLTYPNAIGYVKRIMGVVHIYWSLYYPLLGEASPGVTIGDELPKQLNPFLEEEGARCKTRREALEKQKPQAEPGKGN